MLPVIILVLSIVLTAFFYGRLPDELAYNFKFGDAPDNSISRTAALLLMFVPQILIVVFSAVSTWGIIKLSSMFRKAEGAIVKPERMLMMMGNMLTLPQIILCFAIVDIFSYNSYQTHLMPLWLFALIVMVVASIALGIVLLQAMKTAIRSTRSNS